MNIDLSYENGELACKDCGSNVIVDEVVDFCGKCRSYNVGFRFANGEFEAEPTEEEINQMKNDEQLRIDKRHQELRDNAIPASKIYKIFDTIMNLDSDFNFAYRMIKKRDNPELLALKNKFTFTNLPNQKSVLKDGNLKPRMIDPIIFGNLRRLKEKVNIFNKFELKTIDISILDNMLEEINYPNEKYLFYFNDFEDRKDWKYPEF